MAKERRRYTDADRAEILGAAKREGLSGPKAAKKFGISTLTFYNWRKRAGHQASVQASGETQTEGSLALLLRTEVRSRIAAILPGVVQEEVGSYLALTFGRARQRRRRL